MYNSICTAGGNNNLIEPLRAYFPFWGGGGGEGNVYLFVVYRIIVKFMKYLLYNWENTIQIFTCIIFIADAIYFMDKFIKLNKKTFFLYI